MNELRKTTLTTLEVAEMMETEHWKLLRKIEGGTDRRGYIEILANNQMDVSEYFIKSTYRTEQNKEMPCYEVTRLGCDFLANKFTGEKGVIFTARYVKRFYELEEQVVRLQPSEIPIGEIASYLKAIDRAAVRQNTAPHKIMEAFVMVSEQFGIRLPADLVKVPAYEQMSLSLKNGEVA